MFKTIDQTVLYQLEYIYFIISLSMSTPTLDWGWAVSDQTFLYRLDYTLLEMPFCKFSILSYFRPI